MSGGYRPKGMWDFGDDLRLDTCSGATNLNRLTYAVYPQSLACQLHAIINYILTQSAAVFNKKM